MVKQLNKEIGSYKEMITKLDKENRSSEEMIKQLNKEIRSYKEMIANLTEESAKKRNNVNERDFKDLK
jgi:uncharacterized coiled-coil DUF342 family protein